MKPTKTHYTMKRRIASAVLGLAALAAFAYTVTAPTLLALAGTIVTVTLALGWVVVTFPENIKYY